MSTPVFYIDLEEATTIDRLAAKVAFKVARLNDGFFGCDELTITVRSSCGFSRSECFNPFDYDSLVAEWSRKVWAGWETHQKRMAKLDELIALSQAPAV